MRKSVVASITKDLLRVPPIDGTLLASRCPTIDGTLYNESIAKKVKKSPRWYAKSPASVSLDNSLSDAAFRTFCVMALKTKGPICSVGVRYLSQIMSVPRSTVARRIAELVKQGHMKPMPRARGTRAHYRLSSPAFLKACPKCKQMTDALRESGVCWVCDERRIKSA